MSSALSKQVSKKDIVAISPKEDCMEVLSLVSAEVKSICARVPDETYVFPVSPIESIGKHVRHIIGFIEAMQGVTIGHINYDARERDKGVETSREIALSRLNLAIQNIADLMNQYSLDTDVITSESFYGRVLSTPSKFGRDIMYLPQHTQHHFDSIKKIALDFDIDFGDNFGVACSTVQFHNKPR